MNRLISRRLLLSALGAGLSMAQAEVPHMQPDAVPARVSELERRIGGRIGLSVLDTTDGKRLAHRTDERFAMCSTFKLMLAAAILSRVDKGALRLEQLVPFARSELLPHSPLAEAHPKGGSVPLNTMLQSVIEASDNTAANRLLALIGGPPGYTSYLRGIGDIVTRLDRMELDLNSNLPGDVRDTTTPHAMLDDVHRVLLGDFLSKTSCDRLLQWMRGCQTGLDRLRARLPAGWEAGDKTGTGPRGAVNDLAIFLPPGRAPILVVCYLTGSSASMDVLNGAHAQIGSWIASSMG